MTKKDPRKHPETMARDDSRYRPGIGIVLFNAQGLVFVGERLDNPGAWQMPQGGIDEGENLEVAVFREMQEEIGTKNASILGMLPDWLYYDLPQKTAQRLWDGRFIGQRQKWVALAFSGADSEIQLDTDHRPEFGQWKWVSFHDLLDYAVPFKRDVYIRVIEGFAHFSEQLKGHSA